MTNLEMTMNNIDYSLLPKHMQDGFRRYIERGIMGGSFMEAVLCNDLKGAFGKADEINRAQMFKITCFLHNEMPAIAQGSRERIQAWIERGGLSGNQEAA